jgi:hypothetical protein
MCVCVRAHVYLYSIYVYVLARLIRTSVRACRPTRIQGDIFRRACLTLELRQLYLQTRLINGNFYNTSNREIILMLIFLCSALP